MVKDNVLYFGYGDVSVGSRPVIYQESFRGFRPPSEIGSRVAWDKESYEAVDYTSEEKTIEFEDWDTYAEFSKHLTAVEHDEYREFEFQGLVFNFEKNNKESVEVVRFHAGNAIQLIIQCMAC